MKKFRHWNEASIFYYLSDQSNLKLKLHFFINRLGLLNVKVGVAKIIQNFRVTPDPRFKYPIKLDPKATTMEPIGKFLLKFERV